MTTLILTHNGTTISHHRDGSAIRIGDLYVSPAYAGWSHGDYELIEAPAPEPDLSDPVPPDPEEVLASLPPVSIVQITGAMAVLGRQMEGI